jgi:hypothetical protein
VGTFSGLWLGFEGIDFGIFAHICQVIFSVNVNFLSDFLTRRYFLNFTYFYMFIFQLQD